MVKLTTYLACSNNFVSVHLDERNCSLLKLLKFFFLIVATFGVVVGPGWCVSTTPAGGASGPHHRHLPPRCGATRDLRGLRHADRAHEGLPLPTTPPLFL